MKKAIVTAAAPSALGPYSQAIAFEGMLFCAGQVPLVPGTPELVSGGIAEQTTQVLENLGAVLEANQMSFEHVVKTTVFMTDLGEFASMNQIYAQYFPEPFPARSTVQVSALPKGAKVEIEAIAIRK